VGTCHSRRPEATCGSEAIWRRYEWKHHSARWQERGVGGLRSTVEGIDGEAGGWGVGSRKEKTLRMGEGPVENVAHARS